MNGCSKRRTHSAHCGLLIIFNVPHFFIARPPFHPCLTVRSPQKLTRTSSTVRMAQTIAPVKGTLREPFPPRYYNKAIRR